MVIRVNHRRVIARAIEWSDKLRRNPIGFKLKCPHCWKEQWACANEFYTAFDGTKNNYRCKKCGKGAAPRRLHGDKGYSGPSMSFNPKCPGWRSIYSDHSGDVESDIQ